MCAKLNNELLSEMMSYANIGWWIADLNNEVYTCSEYISGLLGLGKDGIISFENFNKRILNEGQRHTSVHSFDTANQKQETVYLLDTIKGPVWVRSKICMQKSEDNGTTKIYGIAEIQDGPDMSSASQALQQSERLSHNIYKNLPVGIELYNIDGVLTNINDKELEMFHLEQEHDILGINIFDNPVFPEEMKEKLKKFEDADFTFRYDFSEIGDYYKTQQKKGFIDMATKVTTLYDDHCNPINYLLINADKTETTVAYNKIQEFESLFELVSNYAKVGYAYYNMATNKGHAQHIWYENIGEKNGTPLSEIIGVYPHLHPDDRVQINSFIRNAMKGLDNKFSREVRVLRKDGTYTWTHINLIVKEYDPENRKIEIIAINYDITKLKNTESMLIKAKEKAEEADRLKSAFLDNMSHEIRTPLNAITGFSSLLPYATNEQEREQYIYLINHNNELLLNIINDVLSLSKIESGYMELHYKWFNPAHIINESITEYEHSVNNGVELKATIPANSYMIEQDEMRIKQILNNLISNALKNTTKGYVEVSYEVYDDSIRIIVTDTGCGIPENKIDKIFERFEKVDPFVQGAGIGLSICKSIVEKMKGEIKVNSVVDKGSTFTVVFPCKTKQVQV